MSQEGMDYAKEFMHNNEHGLFVAFSFRAFFHIDVLKDWINTNDADGHYKKNAPQAFIPAFRDMSSAFPLAGFVDGGIEPGISNEFLRSGEGSFVGLGQEVSGRDIVEAADGVEDAQGVWDLVSTELDKLSAYILKLLLQPLQDTDLGLQDCFEGRRGKPDRGLGRFDQKLGRDAKLAATAVAGENLENGSRRGLEDGVLRRKSRKQAKRRDGKWIKEPKDLGEEYPQKAFNLVFEGNALAGEGLAFSGQSPELISRVACRGQVLSVDPQELGDGSRVPLVCFGLPQGELSKVRDEQGVEKPDIEMVRLKEGEEVQIVGTRRLHSEPKRRNRGALRAQRYEDVAEPLGGRGERSGPKKLALVVDQRGMEAILGDIDAAEVIAHHFTSNGIIETEAGNGLL